MKHIMPAGLVFQAGTLSGNAVAMAAGLATLKERRDHPPYARLEELGQRLAGGLDQAATAAGIPHQVARVGSMWTFFFNPQPVTDYDVARQSDTARFAKFFWGIMERGIYLPLSQFEAGVFSIAPRAQQIDASNARVPKGLDLALILRRRGQVTLA